MSTEFLSKAETALKGLILSQVPTGTRLYLFGSRARDDAHWNSDFDVLIDTPVGKEPTAPRIHAIKDLIDESWVPFKVDLITKQQCTGLFGQMVLSESRLWA